MFVIGISGGSGSGKTSFIRDIKKEFAEDEITVLSQDEYYHPKSEQFVDTLGVQNYDLPTSIDLSAFTRDIERLQAGEIVQRQEYTFNNKEKEAATITYHPRKILLVEGLFIFHEPKIRQLLDFSVIIHASDVVKVIRRIKRDRVERNYPLEDVLYRYEHHVMPSFDKYIRPYLDKVDVVINNNHNYKKALQMMVGYLNSLH